MAKLIYSAIMSLDGYIEDRDGKFDWAVPDKESHAFINDLERQLASPPSWWAAANGRSPIKCA